jgi:hypothetical protein
MVGVNGLCFEVYLVKHFKHRLHQSVGRSNIHMQSTRFYSLIPTTDDTPWQANKLAASQKIPTFNGTQKLITGFTKAHQWALFLPKLIQPRLSHTIDLRHIFKVFLLSLRNFSKCLPPHVSRPKFCMHLCLLPRLLHAPPHLFSLFYRGADKYLARPGRKRLTGHLQPRRNWPTWASNVLITHPILRIWPRRTTTSSLDWKKTTEREVSRTKDLPAPLYLPHDIQHPFIP